MKDYIALHRSIALIRVYLKNREKHGYFRVYGKFKKTRLYDKETSKTPKGRVMCSFFGNFAKDPCELIDMKKYDEAKDKAINDIFGKLETPDDKFSKRWKGRASIFAKMLQEKGVKRSEMASRTGINVRDITELISEAKFNDTSSKASSSRDSTSLNLSSPIDENLEKERERLLKNVLKDEYIEG